LGKILACFFYSIHRAFVATEQSLDTDRGLLQSLNTSGQKEGEFLGCLDGSQTAAGIS